MKHLSWRINDTNYAYLYIPGKRNHVSERITDSSILNKMMNKVGSWDEKTYYSAFDEMNNEVNSLFGIKIPYSKEYFDSTAKDNIILLSTSNENVDKIDSLKNELLDIIDERFSQIMKSINDFNNEMIALSNKRTTDAVNATKEKLNSTLDKLNDVKTDVEKKFNDAAKIFNKAAKVLELDNDEINADSIKDLFKVANRSDRWITSLSGDVETIRKDYIGYREKMPLRERGEGVFNQVYNKFGKIDGDFKTFSVKNAKIDASLKKIENEQKAQREVLEKPQRDEVLSSPMRSQNYDITKGDYNIKIDENQIFLRKINTNSSIIIDSDGIKLNGDVFINGKKQ